jgi:hypothetical protein
MNFLDTALRKAYDQASVELAYLDVVTTTPEPTKKPNYGKSLTAFSEPLEGPMQEIGLQLKKDVVLLEPVTTMTSNSEEEIQKMKDVDKNFIPEFYINQRVNQEHATKKEQKLYNLYRSLGIKTEESVLINKSKYKQFLKKLFPKLTFPTYFGGLDDQKVFNLIISKILSYSNLIAVKTRRGPANFIVLNEQMGAYLKNSSVFYPVSTTELLKNVIGQIYFIGTFSNMQVFVNPYLKRDDNFVVLGRKTTENNPGVVCLEGEIKENRLVENKRVTQSVTQMLAIKEYGNNPEDLYVTINFNMNKKPLWRKLLDI